ncbi:hypothetical protein ABMA28_000276 [Loxostege sticticalis]|uniref:BCL2-associated athanogene 6 n=1 Tax=Loxostege sticticalis TaxID=481309 RepID=A0ABD0TRN1_LOXSC
MIEFTIKTLDSTNHRFTVEDETTVEQLKEKVREQMGIETGLQRLIFCGRVLQDEKKLSDYDVHGKVVHLVQRAPPGPETRSSSAPRYSSRSGRQFHSNGTFNGPAEDGETLPFHHEMRRLMNLAATPDFVLDHHQQMSLSPTAGRMETARRLIAEIKSTLGCLRAHIAGEREPQFDESGEEITGDPAARPQSARRRVARTMRTRHTQPRHLAQLIDELDDLNEQFAPHRANYTRLLRSANDPQPPSYTDDERQQHQRTVEMVTDLMHSFSHAYHALSDIMFTVGNPRLSAEAAVTRHLIPMQAHINVISAAPVSRRNQQGNATGGGASAGGASATQTSGANDAAGGAQPNRGNAPDLENLFRGMGPGGLGGVEVVMSMEEIPSVALGNLGNLASGNAGLNNMNQPAAGQQGQDGGVYFAPMAAFASGSPPDANMLQNILQHLIRQGLVPGLNEGVTLQPSQIPQQFHQFLNIPPQPQNSTNQSDANPPASPGPPTTHAETQTNMQGIDSVLVIPGHNDELLDDEDEDEDGQEQAEQSQDEPMQEQEVRQDQMRGQGQTPGQGQGFGQGRVSGQGHVLGQGLEQGQMLAQGHVLAQGQPLGQGQIIGNIIGQALPAAQVIGNNQIYGPPQDPFQQTQGSQGWAVPGPARVQALARAQAQAQVQAMAQAQVQAQQQAQAQAQSQPSGETSAPGQTQTAGATQSGAQTQPQTAGQGQTQGPGQAQGQQAGQNNDTQRQPNLHMRRAAFGNRAHSQALALANMFYDRFLQCESPHARRRLQRRRNQQQQLIEQRDQVRNERASQQNIESLCLRRSQIRPTHMCTIMTLLNGESSPQAYLNAFMIAVSRQLYMNELLHASNGMPALVPHEFQSLRMLVRNYVNELITASGTSESDHAFQGVADYLVDQYAGFINSMNNITTMHPDMDPLESIRAFVRARLPAFIASVMCDSNTDLFVARFYSMFLRLFTDLCALVYHMCAQGEAGLRRLFRMFLDHLVESFDEYSRAAILTVGMDNIVGVLPNVASQVENIQQFVRRLDGVMPNLPPRQVATPMEVTPAPRDEQMQTTPPTTPAAPAAPEAESAAHEEPPALESVPRHINITNPRKHASNNAPANRASSSSSSDQSGGSSPTPPASRVAQPEPENTRGSSNSDTNIRFVPPVMILQHWGEEWVPVFTRDQQSQNSPQHQSRTMEPYSDGYLTGMPSRKRRCVRQARPPTTLDGFMNESVHEATERNGTDNGAIRAAFREHMRGLARARASSSDDYDPLRYASAARFLQPRPNKNDNPEGSNKENGV